MVQSSHRQVSEHQELMVQKICEQTTLEPEVKQCGSRV